MSERFRDHQNSIELFKNFRDGNVNPKEVLKNQMRFNSDLHEIKNEIQSLNQKIKKMQ